MISIDGAEILIHQNVHENQQFFTRHMKWTITIFYNSKTLIIFPPFQDDIDEEIPIYIGSIPRYVSGINRKTTCNDIIKGNNENL